MTTAAAGAAFASPILHFSGGGGGSDGLFTRQLFDKRQHNFPSPAKTSIRTAITASASSDNVVTVLDYGAGNVRSLKNAIRRLGFDIKDVQEPEDILKANRLIFPGVGAFAAAINVLNEKGMADALCAYIENDRPFLGICLGLQLLFESSEENGPVAMLSFPVKGLGLIPGVVGRFDSSNGLSVPHIGWNALHVNKGAGILDDVANSHVYFVHSYRAIPSDSNKEWVTSTCNYGGEFIASVIACLDVRANDKGDLVVTKGDQYDVREHTDENEVRNLGKPVELAGQYYEDGADEVSFLNITGFRDFPLGDLPMLKVLRFASENVFVPLTVGGGIRDFTDANGRHYTSLEVASEYFRSGADKISIGSDAVYAAEEFLKTGIKSGKSSLEQISRVYGNQVQMEKNLHGISARKTYHYPETHSPPYSSPTSPPPPPPTTLSYTVTTTSQLAVAAPSLCHRPLAVNGGREGRPIGAYELAKAVEDLGAGEILLNCIDCDGQGKGFDIDLVNLISDAVNIPVIASSGAGAVEHFSEVFEKTNASAALAAGIFHRKEIPVQAVKEHLLKKGIEWGEKEKPEPTPWAGGVQDRMGSVAFNRPGWERKGKKGGGSIKWARRAGECGLRRSEPGTGLVGEAGWTG
ncbi:hypothetical protein KSS87_004981 [Heliosperma pusillum]|nr:hypothetical protein KSS87_004981 [Heliosperma pusillum]